MLAYVCCALFLHQVWLFATPWTTRLLCPWNFPGKNTGVSCHFLLQGVFPNPGIEPSSVSSPALAGGFFTTEPPGKPSWPLNYYLFLDVWCVGASFFSSPSLSDILHSSGFPQKFPFFGLARLMVLPTWALTLTIKTQHGWHSFGII